MVTGELKLTVDSVIQLDGNQQSTSTLLLLLGGYHDQLCLFITVSPADSKGI